MDIKDKIRELILEGENVIQVSQQKGLYDIPYFAGEQYVKWINKCVYIMEQNFKGSKWYENFISASNNAVGSGKESYDVMIGVLKAISESDNIEILGKTPVEKKKSIY